MQLLTAPRVCAFLLATAAVTSSGCLINDAPLESLTDESPKSGSSSTLENAAQDTTGTLADLLAGGNVDTDTLAPLLGSLVGGDGLGVRKLHRRELASGVLQVVAAQPAISDDQETLLRLLIAVLDGDTQAAQQLILGQLLTSLAAPSAGDNSTSTL